MAVTGYPYERQDTTETQYANLFSELQDPGVIGSALGAAELRATFPGGLVVRIAAGRAFARGFILDNDSDFDVNVGPADTQSRVDRIVARVNPVTDTSSLEHLRGVPGSGAPRPLVRTFTGAYDVPLYRFTVAGGAVAPTDLVDERQWVSHRVRMWRTADRELVAPRLGQVGYNLTTGRWEGWAGQWATFTDSRERLIPGGALAGGTPPADAAFYRQAGYRTVTTQPDGAAIVGFPQPFPEGLLSVQVTLFTGVGVGGTPPATAVIYAPESTSERRPSRSAFHVNVRLPNGSPYPSATFGIGYDAVGW